MVHSVFPQPVDLPRLLDYFIAAIAGDDSTLPEKYSAPNQLELVMGQGDLSIRVLHEGESEEAIPSWYTAETRRQNGFTSDYFQQISAAAEASAHWKTKTDTPVVAHQHSSGLAPLVYFFEVRREPERVLFTLLGYLVTEERNLGKEPVELLNSAGTVYLR